MALTMAGVLRMPAAPPARPATPPVPPKSVFVLPSRPQEGRDPFFPNSTRPYDEARVLNHIAAPAVTDLKVQTILVNPSGKAFAVLNDQTFAAGDEGDVITDSGRRIHVRCLEINPAKGAVTVESGGVQVTLNYRGN